MFFKMPTMAAKLGEFKASMKTTTPSTPMPSIKATSKSATATGVLQLEIAFRAFEDLAFTTVAAVRHFSFISLTATLAALK